MPVTQKKAAAATAEERATEVAKEEKAAQAARRPRWVGDRVGKTKLPAHRGVFPKVRSCKASD